MSESIAGDAILLRRVDYGEADVIVTLLSREAGKISALARAARKSRRRFGGALQLATVSRIEVTRRPRSELWTMSSAKPVRSFPSIATDVAAFAHVSYGVELVRELSPAEVADPDVFDLAVELFETLDACGAVPFVLRSFEMRLLAACGLAPVLSQCARCGAGSLRGTSHADPSLGETPERPGALERGAIYDPDRGGVVCADCAAASRGLGVKPISQAAREHLAAAARAPSLRDAASNPPVEGAASARDIALATIHRHIGKTLKSVEFIAKMAAGPRPV